MKEAKLVQDGHTASEQVVYDYLWRIGTPLNANLRSVRIGLTGLEQGTGVSKTTAKAGLRGLIEKLAIDRVNPNDWVLGAEYHVHSWGSCLTRRKAAGLTHVVKSKGVVFVNPETGLTLTSYHYPGAQSKPSGLTPSTVGSQSNQEPRGLKPSREGVLEKHESSTLGTDSSPYNHPKNQNIITTTCLREELAPYTQTDEAGLRNLIEKVKANAPDATWEELKYFIYEKGAVLKKVKIMRSSFGFLLNAIPKCFESPSFQIWRQSREAAAHAEQSLQERSEQFLEIQHLRAVLIDPAAAPEEKKAAQEILEALGEGN